MTRNEVFEKLYDSYCTWYDMERCGGEKTPLRATGAFHATDNAYMLVEKAKMWTAHSNDYLYVFEIPKLTPELFDSLVSEAKESGEKLIHPGKDHKCSYITALFICEEAEPEALRKLSRYKFRKDFLFGFRGWQEIHTALVRLDDGSISTNGDGRNTGRFLKNILFPKKKGS
jgi:hypothetical protein